MNIVDAGISDHNPVLLQNIASFNILCQCRGRNNAFHIFENDEQYANRLLRVSDAIKQLHLEYQIDLFALQEAPLHRNNIFYQHLEKIFHISPITPTIHTSAAMACLFLKSRYEDIKINSNSQDAFVNLAGRFQLFNVFDKIQQKNITLMNVHGDYHKQADTIAAVNQAIALGYIIAGDLNVFIHSQVEFNFTSRYFTAMQGRHTLDVVFI
jgi:hypothetical protein